MDILPCTLLATSRSTAVPQCRSREALVAMALCWKASLCRRTPGEELGSYGDRLGQGVGGDALPGTIVLAAPHTTLESQISLKTLAYFRYLSFSSSERERERENIRENSQKKKTYRKNIDPKPMNQYLWSIPLSLR